ncbi:N-acetylmuramoyl-L-alanine amidase family protein [Aestuariibaculum suncheonense]|uniref:N-acetylmuramoyl-L-alanine amidase n=1 Tax=Aestuariibaculum suncheonense TaxID=1028745 RepID=A0A8J6QT35_9FLAO|nr:N-acetylmuramoyl-L-alanine amidase [Aestuariibaculum suncheonense]MBD0835359.1 N-acetylmuramoyl-L-alanine amidase [Aestuariibaculum suncheonense]
MKTNCLLLFVSFILVLTFSSFKPIEDRDDRGKFVVVLDAGHGGHDPGNMGNGFKEKDIALKIVLEVGKMIEKNPDIKVVYTRKSDVFVDLFVRGQIANKADADLFVSVHCNAHHSAAHGTETFVLGTHRNQTNFEVAKKENSVIFLESDYEQKYGGFDPNSPESVMSILLSQEEYLDQSIQLASLIQKKFTNRLKRKDRGVKQAGFIVLHQTVMPSVLIETGFLTYKEEGGYLNSSKGQREMSTAVADAILEYKHIIDGNVGEYAFLEDTVHEEETQTQVAAADIHNDITFKIQIAASSKALDPKPYNFKGLDDISRIKEGSLYKYFYSSTSDYNQIKQKEEVAKQKGYKSSFIVAFKDGKKISLAEALKTTAN